MNSLRSSIVLLALGVTACAVAAPATCANGEAANHACQRIDLVSHLDLAALGYGDLNDVWGWTDPVGGREYALVGAEDGTVFVDITDAANPRIVGRLPTHQDAHAVGSAPQKTGGGDRTPGIHPLCKSSGGGASGGVILPLHEGGCGGMGSSAWRNIKVYADHAYVGSEEPGHGLQIFDLRQLRGFPPGSAVQRFNETAHYGGFGHSHTLFVDQATGFLYAVGSDTFSGGPHIVDLANPENPVAAGGYAGDGYTHEIECMVYAGPDVRYTGHEICFGSNTDTLTILDVTDKNNIVQVSRTGYALVGYTHQGWLTNDQRYMFMNDELDELDFGIRTRTLVWDLADLQAPLQFDEIDQPRFNIDHNNFINGGYVFQSNYTAGLVILDGRDPRHAYELGYFDTFNPNDDAVFNGTWSNYPFFASGVVAISDISQGLWLVQPRLGGLPEDAGATLTLGGGALPGEPGGTIHPGSAGGTFTISVGPGARFDTLAIDSPSNSTCVESSDHRVLRCRTVDATPFQYSVVARSVGNGPVNTDIVVMVSGGGDETTPTDNRASLNVTAMPGGNMHGMHGGGALDLASLALLALLAVGTAVRRRMSHS